MSEGTKEISLGWIYGEVLRLVRENENLKTRIEQFEKTQPVYYSSNPYRLPTMPPYYVTCQERAG